MTLPIPPGPFFFSDICSEPFGLSSFIYLSDTDGVTTSSWVPCKITVGHVTTGKSGALKQDSTKLYGMRTSGRSLNPLNIRPPSSFHFCMISGPHTVCQRDFMSKEGQIKVKLCTREGYLDAYRAATYPPNDEPTSRIFTSSRSLPDLRTLSSKNSLIASTPVSGVMVEASGPALRLRVLRLVPEYASLSFCFNHWPLVDFSSLKNPWQ
mmetsp:Transcript_26602/g.42166  ORF Transcript_26602/g.42166 Transcript_26602/m.42166 type:complete len:209 (-) Transcript_26602:251-877(-)